MPQYALLIRGINVGKNNRLAMADLRTLLAELGYADVRTLLQSGNAVFTAPLSADARLTVVIEKALADRGLNVRCLVRSRVELAAVIKADPFPGAAREGSKYLAHFLSDQPTKRQLAEHDLLALDPDNIRIGKKVIYQWCPNGILDSPDVRMTVEKQLGIVVTARNWNTLTKLETMMDG